MKIAILGFGTVGSGVYEALISKQTGIEIKKILDKKDIGGLNGIKAENIDEITDDKEISLVVETLGGLHPAYEWTMKALEKGKNVVTANKQLVSFYYNELLNTARMNNVEFRYSASVGGGIPWLYNLKRQKRIDEITSVYGIVNGTTNFILDSMEAYDADFDDALSQAQRMGYAEADPSADIDGLDSKRKCAISASEAFSLFVNENSVDTFGIRNIRRIDVDYYKSKGMHCRLIMTAFINNGIVRAYVEPVLILPSMLEYGVVRNYNLITAECKSSGRLSFFGQGAGKYPTGCTVAGDVIDIAGEKEKENDVFDKAVVDNSLEKHRYYIRSKCGAVTGLDGDRGILSNGEEIIITERISVREMHDRAKEMLEADRNMFIASIGETI